MRFKQNISIICNFKLFNYLCLILYYLRNISSKANPYYIPFRTTKIKCYLQLYVYHFGIQAIQSKNYHHSVSCLHHSLSGTVQLFLNDLHKQICLIASTRREPYSCRHCAGQSCLNHVQKLNCELLINFM